MRLNRRWNSIFAFGVILALIIVSSGLKTLRALPDPQELLRQAAEQAKNAKAFRFTLELKGAPAFIDTKKTISFVSAKGQYVAPDRVSADVVARLLGVPGEVQVVAIGDRQFMNNAVITTNKWLEMQFSPGFNAQKLIQSPDTGIESAINAFTELKLVGQEDLFGASVYHITGKAPTAKISALTVGLIIGTGDVLADIYVDVNTNQADRIVIVQPDTKTDTEDATTWTLETFDYNAPDVTVDEPKVVASATKSATTLPSISPQIPTLPAATATPTSAQ